MKIVRLKLLLPAVGILLLAFGLLRGEEGELPAYVRRQSNSRGLLSMAVKDSQAVAALEKPTFQLLDDVPFSVDTKQEIKENTELQVQNDIPKKESEEEKIEKPLVPSEDLPDFVEQTAQQETPQEKTEKDQPQLSAQQIRAIEHAEKEDEEVVFNFKNADLTNLVYYMETLFGVQFITDDSISPLPAGGKGIAGNKISFKTQKPLTKKQAWSLFVTFLDMAGLSAVQQADPKKYRIMQVPQSQKSAIKSFIGVDSELLPDNDTRIRYVYFVKDIATQTLQDIIGALKSKVAEVLILQELKAFIITDSSYNIKSLMRIIRELDKVSMPQSMSVFKLRRVDAAHVKKLYDSLVVPRQQQGASRIFGPKRSATSLYFPENARMIVEERTNSLILLGTQEDIKKIESFVMEHVDVETDMPYSPLQVHQLKYADASVVADIMNEVARFGQGATAAKTGGVRGTDKFLKQMTFTPEATGNRLVIRGEYEDYLKAKEIIESLDAPQPQVAIEVLILSIGITDIKELGAQIRNKLRSGDFSKDGLFGKNFNFQTSGIRLGADPQTIVQNSGETGAKRLLGDLINLVTGATAGNTILSLGSDSYGVWGIFHALKTITNLQVISNPFLIATNKTKATVSLGEIRNVQTATIEGTRSVETFSDKEAKLSVIITPQINSDGMILLDLTVEIVEFRDAVATTASEESGARTTKIVQTSTILADKEVLALGGLIKNKIENGLNKTPILGNIPLIGWLFKNKKKSETKEDLLILLSARIIDPETALEGDRFTQGHIGDYKSTIKEIRNVHLKRDPIDRAFFDEKKGDISRRIDKFIFKRDKKKTGKKKKRRGKKKREEKVGVGSMVIADASEKPKRKRSRRRARRIKKRKEALALAKKQKVAPVVSLPAAIQSPENLGGSTT